MNQPGLVLLVITLTLLVCHGRARGRRQLSHEKMCLIAPTRIHKIQALRFSALYSTHSVASIFHNELRALQRGSNVNGKALFILTTHGRGGHCDVLEGIQHLLKLVDCLSACQLFVDTQQLVSGQKSQFTPINLLEKIFNRQKSTQNFKVISEKHALFSIHI